MKVGWLQDNPGYIGGAELTAKEFHDSAPEDVEIVYMSPGEVGKCDAAVIQNCVHYSVDDLKPLRGTHIVKYANDVMPHTQPGVKQWLIDNAQWAFCSPLQREKMGIEGECIPPPLDLSRFKCPRQSRKRRKGACSIAQWRNPGKGGQYIEEWSRENGAVNVYGPGPFEPRGPNLNYLGTIEQEKVAQTLWEHETFVFLPFEIEPFCRAVAEAHAAGCQVITNNLIGARHYLENDPEALQTAAEDFWGLVCT